MVILYFTFTLLRTIVDCVTARDCAHEIETFLRLKSFYFVIYLQRLDLRHTQKLLCLHVGIPDQNLSELGTEFYLPDPFPLSTCFSICLGTSFVNMGKTRDGRVRDGFFTVNNMFVTTITSA